MLRPLVPGVVADAAGYAAVALGFDMPRSLRTAMPVNDSGVKDFAAGSGQSLASMLSRNPVGAVPAVLSTEGADEMDLAWLASRPGYVWYGTLTPQSARNSTVVSLPVNPKYCMAAKTYGPALSYWPTPAAMASQPFVKWRGTMRYRLSWSCSAFHTARLRVYYVPSANGFFIPPTVPAVDYVNSVVEVSGPGEFCFEVPFLFTRPFAPQSIGRFCVQVVNPPAVAGDIVDAPIDLFIEASLASAQFSGDGGPLALPASELPLRFGDDPVPAQSPGDIEVAELGLEAQSMLTDATPVSVGPGVYSTACYTHLSQILHAPQLHSTEYGAGVTSWPRDVVLADSNYATGTGGYVVHDPAAATRVLYDLTTGLPQPFATPYVYALRMVDTANRRYVSYTLFNHFACMFWYRRGSVRYAVCNHGTPSVGRLSAAAVGPDSASMGYGITPVAPVAAAAPMQPSWGPDGSYQLEVPYENPRLMVPNRGPERVSPGDMAVVLTRSDKLSALRYYTSGGDDFRYMCPAAIGEVVFFRSQAVPDAAPVSANGDVARLPAMFLASDRTGNCWDEVRLF